MSFILNEYDVAHVVERLADRDDLPHLRTAAAILARLVEWTNENSDGWSYWTKPSNASTQLQQLLHDRVMVPSYEEIDRDELKKLLSPIKAFMTRQKLDVFDRHKILGSYR